MNILEPLKNTEDLVRLKESFNKAFDNEIENKKIQERVEKINTLSFGEIKSLFEGISDKLFDSRSKSVSKYIKTIKENKDLKTLYSLYENAIKPSYTNDVNLLVSSMVSISESLDKNSLKEGMDKLCNILKEGVVEAGVSSAEYDELLDKNKEIYESLNYIFTNKKNTKNLFEHTNKMHDVVSYINENMKKNAESDGVEKTKEELIADLNEAISCKTEWETNAVRDLTLCRLSESSEEELFERYKNECLELLEEKISEVENIEEGIRLSTMKESLSKKVFNKEKLQEDILKIAELKSIFSE